jgi:hypothetical protein
MHGQALVPAFLILAIAFSWPRFVSVFRSDTNIALATAPLTMIASATSLSAVGLAFSENDAWVGTFVVVIGALLGSTMRPPAPAISVAISAANLALYLQFGAIVT